MATWWSSSAESVTIVVADMAKRKTSKPVNESVRTKDVKGRPIVERYVSVFVCACENVVCVLCETPKRTTNQTHTHTRRSKAIDQRHYRFVVVDRK